MRGPKKSSWIRIVRWVLYIKLQYWWWPKKSVIKLILQQARIRGYLAKAESQLKEETLSKNQESLVQDMVSFSRFDRANSTPHSGSRLQKQTKSSQISWQLLWQEQRKNNENMWRNWYYFNHWENLKICTSLSRLVPMWGKIQPNGMLLSKRAHYQSVSKCRGEMCWDVCNAWWFDQGSLLFLLGGETTLCKTPHFQWIYGKLSQSYEQDQMA